ncbi:MAG: PTS sugar transporter subunit IIC [Eubacteriaceae bacterium]|nr:PTS sugar transporter subunit IIC [Eubacteriaceae bacterium]
MAKQKKYDNFKDFLNKKDIEISVQRYLIDALKYMAFGLFGTLLMGSILNQIGVLTGWTFLTETIWPAAKVMTGPAIAVAVAWALNAPPLVLFSITIGGYLGNELGGPAGALIAALVATECGKAVAGETKIDILVTPFVTILIGAFVASLIGPPIGNFMTFLGNLIMWATEQQPVIMGVVIAVIVGIVLTLPISSAALCIMLNLTGLAAGAATVGCCCQMVGFAVQSFKDNGVGGLAAQGLGTSMIQVPNIIKNWKIWIPPTVASAILGPLATTVFQMKNTAVAAGMGTCGLVGQIGTAMAMGQAGDPVLQIVLSIGLLQIILPAIVTYGIYHICYRKKWIKDGDMALNL